MTDFGKGIYLNNTEKADSYAWDIEVDESGDVRSVANNEEELLKDVAFRSSVYLQDIIGRPTTPENMNRIRSRIKQAVSDEPRIDRIISLDARRNRNQPNTVEVNAQVVASDEIVDLIFPVSE